MFLASLRNSHLFGSTLTAVRYPPPLHCHDPPLLPPPSLTLTVSPQNRRHPTSEGRDRIVVVFSRRHLNVAAASSLVFIAASSPVSVATSSKIMASLRRRCSGILAGLSRSLSVNLFAVRRSSFCLLVKNCKELGYHFMMPYTLSLIVLPAMEVSTRPAFVFLHHLSSPLLKASDDASNEPFDGNVLLSTYLWSKKGIDARAIGACHLEAIQGVTPPPKMSTS
ncbi:hypothetical protein HN873_062945 [Arachis hypogaea]